MFARERHHSWIFKRVFKLPNSPLIACVLGFLQVIDEIYRVLRYVNSTRAPQRAHEVLQELRDISSMAMEHFDENVVSILKKKLPGGDLSGHLIGSAPGNTHSITRHCHRYTEPISAFNLR